jgi:glycosyltransferase involved in cell wall biosynthesis
VKLSVVIPTFNEEPNLALLHRRLTAVLSGCANDHELIFVDDCSTDGTLSGLRQLAAADRRVRFISFSRNFGHEIAVAAGIDRAFGDAVVIIDADLQDPPELIEEMTQRWRAGAHVVYAQRRHRRGDSVLKRSIIFLFYRLLGRLSEIAIPPDTGNFRLIDRRVADVVRSCRENPRFLRGLVPWAGFRQEAVQFDRDERHAGKTSNSLGQMVRLAFEGLCSFSLVPLRFSTWIGAGAIALSIILAVVVVLEKIFFNTPEIPRGFAFLACVMLFIGGVQLFMLGMLATYIGYIFKNVQQRPLYVIASSSDDPAAPSATADTRVVVRTVTAADLSPHATESVRG